MKTRISITMMLVMTCILLALPAPVQATPPDPLTINADLNLNGPNSAVGTFNASGLFADTGSATEVFFTADGSIHGVKTLVGDQGTITIRFQANLTWKSDGTGEANGRYVIVSGTGAYAKLHGVGTTHATLSLDCIVPDCPPNIEAHYTGTGHFD
jgi:hypothetical protein